ncbi:zinc finger protein 511 [Denticeps clupeoides]|uniref:C2H2-type domain-containing protein n=1 Tax=Denticeps clupeoides TaxID=299321 RepID=A0AAY4B238_9TELE|nr:zinc finger protein 511 [Denticeps clupeoides]
MLHCDPAEPEGDVSGSPVDSVRVRGTSSPFTFTPRRIQILGDHELFEDGDIHRHLYLQDLFATVTEDSPTPKVSEFRCHIAGCSLMFSSLDGYEQHYSTLHQHVCSTCRRCFPSRHLLDIHILEWHDSFFQVMAEKQSMYQCLVEGCPSKFSSSNERKDHLIRTHSYPPDFRFDRPRKNKRPKRRKGVVHTDLMDTSEEGAADSGTVLDSWATTHHTHHCEQRQSHPADTGTPTQYSRRVPSSVCFGQGSVRGFRGRREKK